MRSCLWPSCPHNLLCASQADCFAPATGTKKLLIPAAKMRVERCKCKSWRGRRNILAALLREKHIVLWCVERMLRNKAGGATSAKAFGAQKRLATVRGLAAHTRRIERRSSGTWRTTSAKPVATVELACSIGPRYTQLPVAFLRVEPTP